MRSGFVVIASVGLLMLSGYSTEAQRGPTSKFKRNGLVRQAAQPSDATATPPAAPSTAPTVNAQGTTPSQGTSTTARGGKTPGPAASGASDKSEPLLPGEAEAIKECKKYPPGKKFKWELRGEVDLMTLLNSISPMFCRPFIVPGNVRQSKVTILAPDTMTAPEAYRMFLSALESMGLTVQPEGKVLKIIESSRARESAIPIYGSEEHAPTQDQYVTRLVRLENISTDEIKGVLDRLKGKDGEITPYAPTNTLVITDLATNIKKLDEVIRLLDVPMSGEKIFVIKLHSVAAKEMGELLNSVFGVGKAPAPGQARPRINIAPGTPPAGQAGQAAPAAGGNAASASGNVSVSQIIPVDRLNMLIIVSTDRMYQQILALVKRLDQQKMFGEAADRVHVVPLENANADDVASTLTGIGASVSRGGGSTPARGAPPMASSSSSSTTAGAPGTGLFEADVRIASDKPTNSLVVLASGRDYITVRDLIRKLDIPRRQVFVEATILEVSIDKGRKLGLAFHGGSGVDIAGNQSLVVGGLEGSDAKDPNSIFFNPAALTGLAAGLVGPAIPEANTILGLPPGKSIPSFGAFIQAIQTNGDVNVISMPHVLTTDNEKATISVGQNLPFPSAAFGSAGGLSATPGTTGAAGSVFGGFGTPVQRQDVALKLDITPHVNDSDFVRLEIDNEISDVINENFNGLGPATSKRTVKSVVTVRDQQSIVLGGLIKDRLSETVEKVPLLGDIPILGYLFKITKKTVLKQNLLIILTPYVIKDPNDLRRIFERKVRERREFMEQYSSFRDERDYEADVDFRRKRGLLEEINRTAVEAELEAREVRQAEEAIRGREIEGAVEVPFVPPTSRTPAPTGAPALGAPPAGVVTPSAPPSELPPPPPLRPSRE